MCTELHEEQQTDTDDRSDGFKGVWTGNVTELYADMKAAVSVSAGRRRTLSDSRYFLPCLCINTARVYRKPKVTNN